MIRVTVTVAGLTLFSIALGFAPSVVADPGSGQYVRTQSGAVRCLVMATDQGHGGEPGVACEHGHGFTQAPMSQDGIPMDLAVVHSSGTFNWMDGNIGGGGTPQNDLVLNYGQTYHIPRLDDPAEQRRHPLHQRRHRTRHVCEHRERLIVLGRGLRDSSTHRHMNTTPTSSHPSEQNGDVNGKSRLRSWRDGG